MDKKDKINALFAQVINMTIEQALEFLDNTDEDLNVINQVKELISEDETQIELLKTQANIEALLSNSKPQLTDLIGEKVGTIEILKLLGKGGMSDVYLGIDKQLQRKVAVKTIKGVFQLNQKARERFRREALILSKLDHENVCKIYNILEKGDTDYLILEYIDGQTLDINSINKKSYSKKLNIARDILSGLIVAHEQDIVHRDLKPDNIIISKTGVLKILDFGISASLKQPQEVATKGKEQNDNEFNYLTTNPGTILGTLRYMPPEQAKGESISTASDIYSTGILLHEIFSTNAPYPEVLPMKEMLKQVKKGNAIPLENVPSDLSQLINRMKAKKSASRPTALDAHTILTKIIDKPKRRRKQFIIIATIIASLLSGIKYTYDLNQQKIKAENSRKQAEIAKIEAQKAQKESEQITIFLESLFLASNPYKTQGKEITARQMLDEGAMRIDDELKEQPQILFQLKSLIGEIYFKLGHYDKAQKQFKQAQMVYQSHKLDDFDKLIILDDYKYKLAYETNQIDQMESILKEMSSLVKKQGLENDEKYLSIKFNTAAMYYEQGKSEQALKIFRNLEQIYNKNKQIHSLDLIPVYNFYAFIEADKGNYSGSIANMNQALSLLKDSPTDLNYKTIIYNNIATYYYDMGNYSKAIENHLITIKILEDIHEKKHPKLAESYDNISNVYCKINQNEKCKIYNQKAIDIYEENKLVNTNAYAIALVNKAHVIQREPKEVKEAEKLVKQAIKISINIFGQKHKIVADRNNDLALNYFMQNNLIKAIEQSKKTIALYKELDTPMVSHHLEAQKNLAKIYEKNKNIKLALQTNKYILLKINQLEHKNTEQINNIKKEIQRLTEINQINNPNI